MMKGFRFCVISALVFLLCIQAASAFSIPAISIDPSGSLTPSTDVTVSFKIENSGVFPSADDLQLFTDLDNSRWTYTIIVNGVENLRPVTGGRTLTISGFELAYKTTDEVAVRITLEGKAPAVTQTSNKTMIRVQEIDARGNTIESTTVERTAMVINIEEISSAIAKGEADLQTFRTHIDEKSVLGIDTSAAEAKYNEAKQQIDAARALPSSQYSSALNNLNAARNAMQAGENALNKAYAESEVAAAQIPINNVDGVIAWFRGNQSTANDPQLSTIITKREVAVSYISAANDQIASGDYAQARVKAQEAYAKANESYNDALDLQKKITSGFNPLAAIGSLFGSGVMTIIVVVVGVVLIAVGFVIYRKRSHWDELG